jgi:hypothetical protein
MKKQIERKDDELRPEYKRSDFKRLVRGKYTKGISEQSNVVVLIPEVAKVFGNAKAVNAALLSLIRIAEKTSGAARKPRAHGGVKKRST